MPENLVTVWVLLKSKVLLAALGATFVALFGFAVFANPAYHWGGFGDETWVMWGFFGLALVSASVLGFIIGTTERWRKTAVRDFEQGRRRAYPAPSSRLGRHCEQLGFQAARQQFE